MLISLRKIFLWKCFNFTLIYRCSRKSNSYPLIIFSTFINIDYKWENFFVEIPFFIQCIDLINSLIKRYLKIVLFVSIWIQIKLFKAFQLFWAFYNYRNKAKIPYILKAYLSFNCNGAISLKTENMSRKSSNVKLPHPSSENTWQIRLRNGFSCKVKTACIDC